MDAVADPTDQPNAEQVEYWNGPEGRHWVDHEARFDAMLAPFVAPILDAAAVGPGDLVLDVGCGNGALGRAAAAQGARVVGVDISGPMLVRAREQAAGAGLDIEYREADAQVADFRADFGSDFDAVVSRFGVMFFSDPEAAFANLGRALRPGGRIAFACWQEMLANEWVAVAGAALVPIVGIPDMPPAGAPGPFAFADPDRVRRILDGAGFTGIAVEPLSPPLLLGGGLGVDEAVEFLAEGGMGKRFLGDADGPTTERARAAVRAAFEPFATAEGVRMGSAAWLAGAVR